MPPNPQNRWVFAPGVPNRKWTPLRAAQLAHTHARSFSYPRRDGHMLQIVKSRKLFVGVLQSMGFT